MIGYNRPTIKEKDINSVKKILKNQWITQGSNVTKFQNDLKKRFGCKYCIVLSSGTAALYLSAIALKIKKNDLVITSPNTFIATVNAFAHFGAKVDLVDIKNDDFTIDTYLLEQKLIFYKKNKKKIKAVIGVDYAGQPCDWKRLSYLSKKYKFKLINDNCHALGSKYYSSEKYAVKYADIVTQSFHAVKNITTGEGGAVFTNSKSLYLKMDILKNHGIEKKTNKINKFGQWYYEVNHIGYNYRLTDFQSALGISQLKSLNKMIAKRRYIAQRYEKNLKKVKNLILPKELNFKFNSYHLYPLQIKFKNLKIDKIFFYNHFMKNGILLQVHYIPIYLQPYYKNKFKFKKVNYPNCQKFYESVFSIPLYPDLSSNDQNKIIKLLKNIIYKYSR